MMDLNLLFTASAAAVVELKGDDLKLTTSGCVQHHYVPSSSQKGNWFLRSPESDHFF